MARFRRRLEEFIRMDTQRADPALRAAAVESIARQSERLVSLLAAQQSDRDGEAPPGIVVPIPFFCPPGDPDRDVRIVLASMDYMSINQSSQALDRSEPTVRKVTEMAYVSLMRGARTALGRYFEAPPWNPRRSYPTDVIHLRQRK